MAVLGVPLVSCGLECAKTCGMKKLIVGISAVLNARYYYAFFGEKKFCQLWAVKELQCPFTALFLSCFLKEE